MGMFRLVKEGEPMFYEIISLGVFDGEMAMRLKHVNPDMTGWEEKANYVTFKLVKLDETGAYFSGFTLKRAGPDALEGYLALRDREGNSREEKFVFRRVR